MSKTKEMVGSCFNKIIDYFKKHWKAYATWVSFSILLFIILWVFAINNIPTILTIVVFFLLLGGVFAFYFFFDRDNLFSNKKIIALIAVIGAVGLYCIYTYNRLFPLSEGWYTFYATKMLAGEVPYKDFHLLFTPIYTYFIAFCVLVFGPKIIFLRIVGVFMLILIAIFAYKIIKLFVDSFFAAPLAIACIYLMQSNSTASIYYDYIFLYNLFNFAGIYFCLKTLQNIFKEDNSKLIWFEIVLSGVFLCLAFLTRQSSGLINIIFAVLIIIFLVLVQQKRFAWKELIWLAVGGIISVIFTVLMLAIQGNLKECFESCFISAVSAKGGVQAELFRWIPYTFYPTIVITSLVLIGGLVSLYIFVKRKTQNETNPVSPFVLLTAVGMMLFIILITVTHFFYVIFHLDAIFSGIIWPIVQILFFISMIVFFGLAIYLLVLFIKNRSIDIKLLMICGFAGFVFFTQFGSCTSGGVSEGQGALSLALFFVCIEYSISHVKKANLYRIFMASVAGFISLAAMTRIKDIAYSWWVINTDSFMNQTETTNLPIIEGIRVDKNTKDNLETMKKDMEKYNPEKNDVYSFCRFPITYTLLDSEPMVGIDVYVPWFDVCTQDALRKDFDLIKEHNPKIIIYERIPENTVSEHENGFNGGMKSVQREMMEYFDSLIENHTYKVVDSFNINPASYFSEYQIDFLVLE